MAPSGSARPVGLLGLQIQTRPCVAGGLADGGHVHRPALRGRPARDGDDPATTLLGVDPVHGVGRGRDHRGLARGQERLGAHVEDLVGAGARDELVGRDAVDGRGGLHERSGSPRAGTPTGWSRTGPSRRMRATRSGGAGEVLRSKRSTCSTGMPKRSATPSSVASHEYEAGSVGEVTANGLVLIGASSRWRRPRSAPPPRHGGRAGPRPRPG